MVEARNFEVLRAGVMLLALASSVPARAELLPGGNGLLGPLQAPVAIVAEQICSLLVAPQGLPEIGFGPGAKTACTNLLAPILGCGALSVFEPRSSPAYDDYPVNGELHGLEYRSYLSAPLIAIVQEAAAQVRVIAAGWSSGHGAPIGLGDMSECDGSIPGTLVGAPAHPVGSHTDGLDIDIAYFQTGTPDNRLRSVCVSVVDGVDQRRCTEPPDLLDVARTALFVDALASSGAVRVIGVDGAIGPLVEAALESLCDQGVTACAAVPLAYETSDTGLGWFTGHHHHMHVSFVDPRS